MKNYLFLFLILLITACSDEVINQDCFRCESEFTTYCINEGDDFYSVIPDQGETTTVLLEDEFWNDIKANLANNCPEPILDCYACQVNETTYCYLPGNDFYTSIFNGQMVEIDLEDQTWQEIRETLEVDCPVPLIQDCYTCDIDSITYCYTEGDNFYITMIDNQETQTDLNGQTWLEIRNKLETNCTEVVLPYHAQMTAIIDGTLFDNLLPLSVNNIVTVTNFGDPDLETFLRIDGNDSPDDFNNITREISLYIHTSFWKEGTYDLLPFSIGQLGNQVNLANIRYGEFGLIAEGFEVGTLTITNFNTETREIQGTFQFSYIVFNVPEGTQTNTLFVEKGTFNYSLDDPEFD